MPADISKSTSYVPSSTGEYVKSVTSKTDLSTYNLGFGTATDGTTNTGGGGGGGRDGINLSGGNGGSGIVIIRYANTYDNAASTTGSPTYTNTGGYYDQNAYGNIYGVGTGGFE